MNYYETNFILLHDNKIPLSEIENMIPWERDILTTQIAQRLKEIEQAKKKKK